MTALALSGWIAAVAALAAAALLHARHGRHVELVAQACHELRGALCAARLAAEALGAPGLELDVRRAALALEDLDLARTNRFAPGRREVVDLADLLEETAAGWGAQVEVGPVASAPVVADRARLAQAVSNLIVNALEHGGGVATLAVRRAGAYARIEVTDDGGGLPAPVDELVEAARGRRGRRGHGLGVAARIAAASGGRLLSAPSARGARLVLELPAVGEAAVTAGPRWSLPDPEGLP